MSSAKSTILCKEEAEKLAIEYAPRKFPMSISPTAHAFHSLQSAQGEPSFKLDKIIAKKTGVEELERVSLEEKVEAEALAKLKEVQESAYQQAYELGLQEGRERAYQEHSDDIAQHLNSLETVLQKIENLKVELVSFNEVHIMKLIYHLASKLAMTEISAHQEMVLGVIKGAIGDVQSEERLTLKVAPADFAFVESVKSKATGELHSFRNLKIEESEAVNPGGCIVETNYGVVDATIEMRVQKLWDALSDKLPKVKDSVGE